MGRSCEGGLVGKRGGVLGRCPGVVGACVARVCRPGGRLWQVLCFGVKTPARKTIPDIFMESEYVGNCSVHYY